MKHCLFCHLVRTRERAVGETADFVIFEEPAPVSPGHVLIVSKDHCSEFFELRPSEAAHLLAAAQAARAHIMQEHEPDGYNIGMNCGEAAGQSQMHFHMHVIPRYKEDHPNPRGGVRNIFPNAPAPL